MKKLAPSATALRTGFTLIELMVTIGIIAVLISILIPTVTAVKRKAQVVNTRAFMTRIETAIQQYQGEQNGALPGPVPDFMLKPYATIYEWPANGVPGAFAVEYQTKPPAITTSNLTPITSSENLYLALSAGLKFDLAAGPTFTRLYFDEKSAENPDGANSTNPRKPHRYSPYLPIDKSESSYYTSCPVEDQALVVYKGFWMKGGTGNSAGGFTGDTAVPEYVDKFSSPMPILYMRANKGTAGRTGAGARFLDLYDGDYNTTPDPITVYPCQYDPEMIQKTYTNYKSWNSRTVGTVPVFDRANSVQPRPWPDRVSSTKENDPNQPYVLDNPASGVLSAGDEAYFGNASTSTATNKQPGKKDEYILISAGPDGRYGTADDITNFR